MQFFSLFVAFPAANGEIRNNRPHCALRYLCMLFFSLPVICQNCFGGATGANWVIVVNADSVNSRTIANHYSVARDIPSRNLIVLNNVPDRDRITVSEFRDAILLPVLKEIETRGLLPHVQGIAYSADFPTAIDIESEISTVENKSQYLTPVASINSLTYLYRFVLQKNPAYISFNSNYFAARPATQLLNAVVPSSAAAKEIEELLKESKHEQLAIKLEELIAGTHKDIVYPMHYLAAQRWALADNPANAISHIEKSIRGG
ncbi:MAG: hypothetical protein ABL921_33095, partial [Pirellula sp.]